MPNPDRIRANGDPLYTSFVDYFGDDVSGNRSKSWNKHWNAYVTHWNLPRKLLQQEFHTHFISTSPNASIPKQFHDSRLLSNPHFNLCLICPATHSALCHRLTHANPVRVWDAILGRTIRFRLYMNAEPSDNPMQAEVSANIGGMGNHNCRKCEASGTAEEVESNEGAHALFDVSSSTGTNNSY